jgi:hypothetical protein
LGTGTGFVNALLKVLNELIEGPSSEAAWLLNPGDPGFLGSLARLTAAEASAVPEGGGSSIAAHVDHLRYGLELLNLWNRGEEPFADADYSASWKRSTVSQQEWLSLQEALRREASAWREAIRHPRDGSEFEFTGVVAGVAHLAYHLGAIRQINRSSRGPSARD